MVAIRPHANNLVRVHQYQPKAPIMTGDSPFAATDMTSKPIVAVADLLTDGREPTSHSVTP
jgi:hypothetical protein